MSVALAAVVLAACGSAHSSSGANRGIVRVVAAENFWGDIARQLGGDRAEVRSIISDPSADPHLYESNAGDAAALGDAQVVIFNGLDYDDVLDKLLATSSPAGRRVVTAAEVLHVTGNDANPHLWYDVPRVAEVARAIVAQLTAAEPTAKAQFEANLAAFETALRPVLDAIATIKRKYPHAPVAYTERVPEYLLQSGGLDVLTPSGFARAIEDGSEPSPADTQAMNTLLAEHRVKVLLYNAQATSPVTEHARDLAKRGGIPVVGVTETIPKTEADYQSWQLHQVQALLAALGG